MRQHIKILGILNIVWGSLGILGGLVILLIFGGVFGIVQAVSVRQPDAAVALPIIGIVGMALSVLLLILSIPSIIAGIGLLQYKNWAKIMAVIVSALHLFSIPFGTALGIYGLWVLCSEKSQECFIPGDQSGRLAI
jgi:hypothetical protein